MRLGADPEIFLQRNGQVHSAIGYIGANKWEPLQIPDMMKGFTLQEDNVALEYGIPPAASQQEFIDSILSVIKKSREWLPKDVSFSNLSCARFPEKELTHPDALRFGCEPDYNAWTRKVNPRPKSPDWRLRSAGGHVHIETQLPKNKVVKACDLFLGVASVLMDSQGAERRVLYGKPGAHRPKPYGVEYRTLSNFWIFTPELIGWVCRNTQRALEFDGVVPIAVRNCIAHNDVQLARTLVNEYSLEVL